MNRIKVNKERVLCGAAFLFFVLITTYKLTNAPLWYDEAVEYWCSKVFVGGLPYAPDKYANMYQKITATFQPPLYNVLMYFWLKVSNSEWWFRFFGVVIGFIGMIGLYKTIRKVGNGYVAALAVVFSACVYRLVYYWQECAEYCLMLGTLFWVVYFWFCLIDNPTRKNIILFTISAVIPVYSQYGAVFPVIAMAMVALVYVITTKDREKILTIVISDAVALFGAALPLYFFFLRKQLLNQQGGEISIGAVSFSGGVFRDFFGHLYDIFKWSFFSYYNDVATVILSVITLVMIIVTVVLSKNKTVKLFAFTNVVIWLLYYISVKIGLYSYGKFGSRYNMFLIPVWIVLLFSVAIEFTSVLARYVPAKFKIRTLCAGIGVAFILFFSCFAWVSKLQANWNKEDCRGAVKAWYEADAENSNTIVYYGANPGFTYYVRQNSQYNETTERNVHYMVWSRDEGEDTFREYVNSIYGNDWPNEIYVVASHTKDDLDIFLSVITSMGYEREDIYSSNAYLIRLFRS